MESPPELAPLDPPYRWVRWRPRPITPVDVRLWRRVDRSDPDACWVWPGGTNGRGYGVIGSGGTQGHNVYVHRVAWESERGPIPAGLEIDHLCRNRLCVNPRHLAVVTHRENNLRGMTVSAIAARRTHCPAGHPYDEANTYRPPSAPNSRMCRACMVIRESKRVRDHRRPTCRYGHVYPADCALDIRGYRVCPICHRGPRSAS